MSSCTNIYILIHFLVRQLIIYSLANYDINYARADIVQKERKKLGRRMRKGEIITDAKATNVNAKDYNNSRPKHKERERARARGRKTEGKSNAVNSQKNKTRETERYRERERERERGGGFPAISPRAQKDKRTRAR